MNYGQDLRIFQGKSRNYLLLDCPKNLLGILIAPHILSDLEEKIEQLNS